MHRERTMYLQNDCRREKFSTRMLGRDGFKDRRRSSGARLDTVGAGWREKKQLVCRDIALDPDVLTQQRSTQYTHPDKVLRAVHTAHYRA